MCSHYQATTDPERLRQHFGAEPPAQGSKQVSKHDLWPGYVGNFCRRHPQADTEVQTLAGIFGLVPPWSPDTSISRLTYNARTENVANRPSFKDAWRLGQHCIVPADALFEPDWRSGKPLPARISHQDDTPLGLAGLWALWTSPQGDAVYSYTLLTINAEHHPLMRKFHKPGDEKRMLVILPPEHYGAWLQAKPDQSRSFFRPYPASSLKAVVAG